MVKKEEFIAYNIAKIEKDLRNLSKLLHLWHLKIDTLASDLNKDIKG